MCAASWSMRSTRSMQSGMASVAESVPQWALGVIPQLRVIEGGNLRDVRDAFDGTAHSAVLKAVEI